MIEQRKSARFNVNWSGRCSIEGGVSFDVRIVDCSEGSFGVCGLHHFAAGEIVTLQIDGVGAFSCKVVWVKGERFGARILDEWGANDVGHLSACLNPA